MDFDVELLSDRIKNSYRFITKGMSPNEEDDCVQECLLQFWRNGRGQTVDQAVIDYLRKFKGGRKGGPGYEARMKLVNAGEIPENHQAEQKDLSDTFDTSILPGKMRFIVEQFQEGFTLREIAIELQITESRVSQIFRDFTSRAQFLMLTSRDVRKWAAKYVF